VGQPVIDAALMDGWFTQIKSLLGEVKSGAKVATDAGKTNAARLAAAIRPAPVKKVAPAVPVPVNSRTKRQQDGDAAWDMMERLSRATA
jgi:predicted amidophosphoribosyltransferase